MNRRRKIINTLMVTIIMNMYEFVDAVVVVVLLLIILSSFVFTCEICTWFGNNKFDCF